MKTPDNIVAIWGVPRSGTTWLGQIFNSSLNTLYRHQPLFSYSFKNRLSDISTSEEILSFLDDITNTEDKFVLFGLAPSDELNHLNFKKNSNPTHLVMKHVRYHYIINNLLQRINNIKIIGIIRHPCATINSWIRAPREFDKTWDPMKEWRFAGEKNMGKIEEFNGYEKWKEVALNFIKYENNYPNNMYILKYNELNHNPLDKINNIFSFCSLTIEEQTVDFINQSTSKFAGSTYSVFRKKQKDDAWKNQLAPLIIEEIYSDLKGTKLEKYLDE